MTCSGQTFENVKTMPDGSRIILIDGKPFRAFTPEQVEEFANRKDTLEVCQANEIRFEDKIKISEQNVTIANQQTEIERRNFLNAMSVYENERKLRIEAMQLTPVTGTPKGFGGWLLKAVNSPYGAVVFRLVIPTAQAIKVFTSK